MNPTSLGWSSTTLALLLATLTGSLLLVVVGLGASNRILFTIGLRNVRRRPSQTMIMLAGLMLSTVFITASFGLQDSFTQSIVADRLMKMGNVDEAVSGTFTQAQLDEALAHLQQMPEVQAAAGIFYQPLGARIFSERTALTAGDQYLYGIPPAFDAVYGPLRNTEGHALHFADLGLNDAFVSKTMARQEDVRPGDRLQVALLGANRATLSVTVRGVLSTDLAFTDGELELGGSYPEIILPLDTVLSGLEPLHAVVPLPNVLCVKNVGRGGWDDTGPDGKRGQPVLDYLAEFFHASPDAHGYFPTYFDSAILHSLKPTIAESQSGFSPLDNKSDFIASPAARQFSLLLPTFTALLVGAGMLLLVLLCLLLAAERRGELGMSRAVGLQRWHLVQMLVIEGSGYAVIASSIGVLLGLGAVALELAVLSQVPGASTLSSHITLHQAATWQGLLDAWCLSVLTMLVVVFMTAVWISRTNIVAAIRDLDEPLPAQLPLRALLRALWTRPRDTANQPLPETASRRFSRLTGTLGRLLWEDYIRGPLCLLGGMLLFRLAGGPDENWLQQLSVAFLIAGGGLLISWLVSLLPTPRGFAGRLSGSLIGIGWLAYGLQVGKDLLLPLFISDISALGARRLNVPSPLALLLSLLVPIGGAVLLVMSNADLLTHLVTLLLRRVRGLAPVSRTGLAYPLTFRFRSGVTVALLSLITFLIILVVTNNLSSIQQSQIQTTTGNFQLEINGIDMDAVDPAHTMDLNAPLLATPHTLPHEIALASLLRFAFDPHHAEPMRLMLPGYPIYSPTGMPGPAVVDATFLSNTTMPLFARAQGYRSDREVWNAVRDQPGFAVLQYVGNVGLPRSQGFAPFQVQVPQTGDPHAPYRQVTVIGLMPSTAHWGTLFFSEQTEASIQATPYDRFSFYYFRLQPGVSLAQGASALNNALQLNQRGIALNSLVQDTLDAYTSSLTLFLAGYLAMGLLFGAFSVGVITSRAVVERRQQIGMLRALGFSRGLVQRSFLLEASFLITASLLTGTLLAGWLAYQITRQAAQAFPLPLNTVVMLLVGSYLVAVLCTVLPARRASRVPPAEALRYE